MVCYLHLTGSEHRSKRVNIGSLPAYLSLINKIIHHYLQQTSLPLFLFVFSSSSILF